MSFVKSFARWNPASFRFDFNFVLLSRFALKYTKFQLKFHFQLVIQFDEKFTSLLTFIFGTRNYQPLVTSLKWISFWGLCRYARIPLVLSHSFEIVVLNQRIER